MAERPGTTCWAGQNDEMAGGTVLHTRRFYASDMYMLEWGTAGGRSYIGRCVSLDRPGRCLSNKRNSPPTHPSLISAL